MALKLPFLKRGELKRRSQMIAVDLGSRTTKAVLLERRGPALFLSKYAILDAPIFDKKMSAELLGEHLKAVAAALDNPVRYLTLALGVEDSVVRQVELPQIPLDEMRQVLRMNHKNYLQQDLPQHTFDCYIMPPRADKPADPSRANGVPKLKVLAAATRQKNVADFVEAASSAGLTAEGLVPGLLGPINHFEQSMPEIYQKETVALVDIGFKKTSVSILSKGELALNRMVNLGGDQLTDGLAQTLNISHAEAEGIKVGMAPEVESALQMHVAPLGREIRASLDFFEHQEDCAVSQVYVSGGSSRSEMIMEMLHSELLVECKTWNSSAFMQLALSGQQAVEFEHIGTQLTTAIGAALAII